MGKEVQTCGPLCSRVPGERVRRQCRRRLLSPLLEFRVGRNVDSLGAALPGRLAYGTAVCRRRGSRPTGRSSGRGSTPPLNGSIVGLMEFKVRLAKFVGIAATLLLLAACDPGWSYRVRSAGSPMGQGTRSQGVSGPRDTSLQVIASQFTSGLTITLRLSNLSASPIGVSPNGLRAFNKAGTELLGRSWSLVCERGNRSGREVLRSGEETTLATGDACEITAYFSAPVDAKVMAEVSLVYDGVRRAGQIVPIRVTLEQI